MLNKKDVRQIMVGKKSTALSTGDAINVGEVAAFTPSGTRLLGSNASAQDKIVLKCKLPNGEIQVSDVIEKAELQLLTAQSGYDDQDAIDYIGFNGTNGDIDAIADNDYFLTVYLQHYYESESDGRYNKHIRAHTGESPDKFDVANQLVRSANLNLGVFSKEPEKYLKAELVSEGANTAVDATVVAFVFIQGSRHVSVTTTTGLSAGDYLRVGTALTDPVYKMEAVDTVNNIVTLATPYLGASATVAHGSAKIVEDTAFDAGKIGVKISGLPLTFDWNRLGRSRFRKAIYDYSAANFGNTPITRAQAAHKGRNPAELVAELEYFQQGFEFGDNKYQIGEPNLFRDRFSVDPTVAFYDSVNFKWRHRLVGGFRDDMSNKELQIFIPADLPAWWTDGTNGLRKVLVDFAGLGSNDLDT